MEINDIELFSRLLKGELICIPRNLHLIFKKHLLIPFDEHIIVHKGDWFIYKKDELAVAEYEFVELLVELGKKQKEVLEALSKKPLVLVQKPKRNRFKW